MTENNKVEIEEKIERIKDLCQKKEGKYIQTFKEILKIEKGEREMPDHFGWSWGDIRGMNPWFLSIMRQEAVIKCTYESNKGKWFRLADDLTVEDIEQAIKEVEGELENKDKLEMGEEALLGYTDKEVEIPENLFSIIYDHEDIKKIFNMSLAAGSQTPIHILLIGKPACAKSLFLAELARLPGALYALGGTSTKAGIRDVIASGVRFLILDELDKVDNVRDLSALLEWMESGKMPVLQHGKYRLLQHPGWAFCACNRKDKLPPELLSRFVVMNIPEYTEEELRGVIKKILTEREGKTEEEAEIIADVVIGYLESSDPRDAIKIARLSKSKDDIETVARIMKKYAEK